MRVSAFRHQIELLGFHPDLNLLAVATGAGI
jgi:hypothetical protein